MAEQRPAPPPGPRARDLAATGAANRDQALAWAYHLLRLGLGGLFVFAGVLKLLHPQTFAHSLAQYDLLPEALIPMTALGLPSLEVLAGLGLILEVRGSLAAISGLMLVFLAVLGYAVLWDLEVDCGCFTLEELGARTSVKVAFWRDLVMLGVIFLLFIGRQRHLPTPWRLKLRK